MSPPLNIFISTIVDAILLPIVFFLTISLFLRLKKWESESNQKQNFLASSEMNKSAVTTLILAHLYYICAFLMHGFRGVTPVSCSIVDGFWSFAYGGHKLGLFAFIYFRTSTFREFLSKEGWARLKIFSMTCGLIYFASVLGLAITYSMDTYDVSLEYCHVKGRINRPSNIVFGGLFVLMDVIVSGTGVVVLARLLWGPVLGQLTTKDPVIGAAAKQVVGWSMVALVSTPMSIVFTLALMRHYGLPDLDIAINCLCIWMQYNRSLVQLTAVTGDDQVQDVVDKTEQMV